ncbi:MAG: hypothetical protein C4555_06440 [Dehalococcoidia bacterium]|nr:MAG: hypothetical protein C4555_06440 [Dehalococcoidia bacterium]
MLYTIVAIDLGLPEIIPLPEGCSFTLEISDDGDQEYRADAARNGLGAVSPYAKDKMQAEAYLIDQARRACIEQTDEA